MEYLFGFRDVTEYLSRLNGRLDRALQEALTDAALLIEKEAKQNIAQGRPEWPRLSRKTILARMRRRKAGRQALARARRLRRQGASVMERAAAMRNILRRSAASSPYAPLYDTGTLMRSITHEVERDRAIVGPTVVYAAIHEFGGMAGRGRRVRIPARPYLVPAARENLGRIREIYMSRVVQAARRR